jgi:hypothetical protein
MKLRDWTTDPSSRPISPIHNYLQLQSSSLHTHRLLSVFCPTSVLWYRVPTTNVNFPGFRNYPRATATTTFHSQCTHWKSIVVVPLHTFSRHSTGAVLELPLLSLVTFTCNLINTGLGLSNNYWKTVKVKVILRPTVSWPIFRLISWIIFGQLRVCWCGTPSLMRSRVCSFQFLPPLPVFRI